MRRTAIGGKRRTNGRILDICATTIESAKECLSDYCWIRDRRLTALDLHTSRLPNSRRGQWYFWFAWNRCVAFRSPCLNYSVVHRRTGRFSPEEKMTIDSG